MEQANRPGAVHADRLPVRDQGAAGGRSGQAAEVACSCHPRCPGGLRSGLRGGSMTRPVAKTSGPVAFCKQVEAALDDIRCGRVAAMSAMYDPSGIGRVSVTTIDGRDVELAFDLTDASGPNSTTIDTAPGKGPKTPGDAGLDNDNE